jgi:hypothetical protein
VDGCGLGAGVPAGTSDGDATAPEVGEARLRARLPLLDPEDRHGVLGVRRKRSNDWIGSSIEP